MNERYALITTGSVIFAAGFITGYILNGMVGGIIGAVGYTVLSMLLLSVVDREPQYGPHH